MHSVKVAWMVLTGRAALAAPLLVSALVHYRESAARARAHLAAVLLERWFGVYVGAGAVIGLGLKMPHPTGIVIGDGVTLGNKVTLYQGVTLGALRAGEGRQGLYPTIEEGAVIFSGSAVLGNVTVGRNSIVGANSVVLSNVPAESVAVGAPARVVKSRSINE